MQKNLWHGRTYISNKNLIKFEPHPSFFLWTTAAESFKSSIIHQFLALWDWSIFGSRENRLLLPLVCYCSTIWQGGLRLSDFLNKCLGHLPFHIINSFFGNNLKRTQNKTWFNINQNQICFQIFLMAKSTRRKLTPIQKIAPCSFYYQKWHSSYPVLRLNW